MAAGQRGGELSFRRRQHRGSGYKRAQAGVWPIDGDSAKFAVVVQRLPEGDTGWDAYIATVAGCGGRVQGWRVERVPARWVQWRAVLESAVGEVTGG